ncbi:MAG TPA: carboxypeptidase-like regulatory domain-containing protein [Chloroflexota bacterium]|jgi:hypothetical protein
MVTDLTPTALGTGGLRGRVLDWRGIGQANFRVHAAGGRMQAEGVSSADGQFQIGGLAPGPYEVRLTDFRSEAAREIPVVAGQITTIDWIEASRGGVAPPPQPIPPTATPLPTATATQVPANLVQRPPTGPARPSPPELAVLQIVSAAAEQLMTAFLTGAAVVTVAAVLTVAIARRRRV